MQKKVQAKPRQRVPRDEKRAPYGPPRVRSEPATEKNALAGSCGLASTPAITQDCCPMR